MTTTDNRISIKEIAERCGLEVRKMDKLIIHVNGKTVRAHPRSIVGVAQLKTMFRNLLAEGIGRVYLYSIEGRNNRWLLRMGYRTDLGAVSKTLPDKEVEKRMREFEYDPNDLTLPKTAARAKMGVRAKELWDQIRPRHSGKLAPGSHLLPRPPADGGPYETKEAKEKRLDYWRRTFRPDGSDGIPDFDIKITTLDTLLDRMEDAADIAYQQRKLFSSLKIPLDYMT